MIKRIFLHSTIELTLYDHLHLKFLSVWIFIIVRSLERSDLEILIGFV